ncbi:MAG: LysM domain-containing protein [Deferrisomatales bacterium]|nr:LysM domain-containing protein [Deferrisomatales bacterium]
MQVAFLRPLAPRLLLGFLLSCPVAHALEAPPSQGSQLQFQKTLFVRQIAGTKVFAESHEVVRGDTLWRLLTEEYGISADVAPTFIAAFRQVNPEIDPDRLRPGSVVRVPFKVEERLAGPAAEAAAAAHVVQPGESLWRILTRRFALTRDEMGPALRSIAAANPDLVDLDHLTVGQRIVIPVAIAARGDGTSGTGDGAGRLPPFHRSVLELLVEMGCTVTETGETFLPLARGRTLRLDAVDFPLITGPGGVAVILDPRSRLAPALVRGVEQAWGYRVVQGVSPDAETQLGRLLPHLGFQEVSEGLRTVAAGAGGSIVALVRWTVLPRTEDLWEGRLHLLFPAGSRLDPALAEVVRHAGFRVHRLGEEGPSPPATAVVEPARLAMDDPAQGAGQLLGLLGVSHRVRPEVECRLAGGVSYRLRPLVTFRHLGLDYAVPPETPAAAESILSRAGYFTVSRLPGARPMNLLTDLLALLGVPHARTTVEVPADGALRMQATGIVLEAPEIGDVLYPTVKPAGKPPRVFLTEARLFDGAVGWFAAQGLLPWQVDAR